MPNEKQNFNSKLHLACAEDERMIMSCVHFVNGYAYASDGKLIIKQSLDYASVLDIEALNGHSIHKNSFDNILKFEIAQANEEGIECWDTGGKKAFFPYMDLKDIIIPDFDAVIIKPPANPVPWIGFNPETFEVLGKVLIGAKGSGIKVKFGGIDRGMYCEVLGFEDQCAIVMPMILNDTLF